MGVELNFDKSFLHFNVKKKIYAKVTQWIVNLSIYGISFLVGDMQLPPV